MDPMTLDPFPSDPGPRDPGPLHPRPPDPRSLDPYISDPGPKDPGPLHLRPWTKDPGPLPLRPLPQGPRTPPISIPDLRVHNLTSPDPDPKDPGPHDSLIRSERDPVRVHPCDRPTAYIGESPTEPVPGDHDVEERKCENRPEEQVPVPVQDSQTPGVRTENRHLCRTPTV